MAAREVFADTSAIFALLDRRDAHHAMAAAKVGELVRAGRTLVVTDYVVTETINLAVARRGRTVAERVLDLFEQSEGIRIEWVGPVRFDAAKAFFRKHSDHGYSFTDATSFIVMRESKITEALTTDGHFAAAGFRPLLPVT
jgi:predicted nucleic acid-binding protein